MTAVGSPPIATLADLLERLGGIAPERVRFHPAPETATERDVVAIERHENRLCELVEGVLVEKAMGYRESLLALALAAALREFVVPRNLGLVSGANGLIRLFPGLVRIPDLAFTTWGRVPGGRVPEDAVPAMAPDLAVEVTSPGNTERELERKRGEYFRAGVREVWIVDPSRRTVTAYHGPERSEVLGEADWLEGGDILPGFRLALSDLFAEFDRSGGG